MYIKLPTCITFIAILLLSNIPGGNCQIAFLDSLKSLFPIEDDSARIMVIKRIVIEHLDTYDSALKYSNMGLKASQSLGDIDFEAKFLMYLSIIEKNNGDANLAIKYGKEAISKFDQSGNVLWAAGMCNTMARSYISILSYDSAVAYCIKGLKYHEQLEVNPGTCQITGTLAYTYELSNNLDLAIEWNRKMLDMSLSNGFMHFAGDAYANIGNVYDLKNAYDSSLYYKHKALGIELGLGDNDNYTANYLTIYGNIGNTHLVNNVLDSALIYCRDLYNLCRDPESDQYRIEYEKTRSAILLGAVNFKLKNYSDAIKYLNEAIILAKQIDYVEKLMEAYEWMYELHRASDEDQMALKYYLLYNNLNSKAIDTKNQEVIQQLTVKYDTEKKEQDIQLLTSQNELLDLQLEQSKLYIFGLVLISILGITTLILLLSRRNYKLRARVAAEKESQQKLRFKAVIDAEEKERKRIAQELHDGLGQLLSTARLNVSVLEDDVTQSHISQLTNSLKLIDEAVSEVRSISHNMMPNALVTIGFEAALKEQVHLINDSNKIKVHLSLPESPMNLEESKAIVLYRILQEVLNNAIKYADANNLWIEIEYKNDVNVHIKDDGKGFDTKLIQTSTGIGWENVYSRADILNAQLDVRSKLGVGTEINLKMAV